MQKACKRCNKEFYVRPCQARTKTYCSVDCRYPERGYTKQCQNCGKDFRVHPSTAYIKHCSKLCNGETRSTRIRKTCLTCSKEFVVRLYRKNLSKYCSKACFTFGHNKKCATCGITYFAQGRLAHTSKFCSNKCRYPELHKAKEILSANPDLKWCSQGKHVFSGHTSTKACCPTCHNIDAAKRFPYRIHAAGQFTVGQWNAKKQYFGHRCYLCKEYLQESKIHIEHRIPLSRGGTNWIANIAPACANCNYAKHAKTEKEYRATLLTP